MRAAGATTAVAARDAPERGASLGAARAGAPRARIAFENFGRELSGRAPQTFFSHFLNAASPTHGQLTRRARSYLLPPLSLQPRDRCTRCVARRPLGRQRGELFGEARLRHIEAVARQAGRQHRMRNGPRCGGQGRAGLRVRLRVGSGPRGQGPTLLRGACVIPRRVSFGMPRWSVRKSQSSSPPAGHAGTTISPMATASSSSLRLGPARSTAAAYLPSGRQAC